MTQSEELKHKHNWMAKEWETVDLDIYYSGNNQFNCTRSTKTQSYLTKVICLECGEEMEI